MVKRTKDLEQYFKENLDVKFEDYLDENLKLKVALEQRLDELGIKKSTLAKDLRLDSTNIYKYFNGDKKFKRDTLLKVLIYLQFDVDEINTLLKTNGHKDLYVKNLRDQIIYHGIVNNLTIEEIEQNLVDSNEYKF